MRRPAAATCSELRARVLRHAPRVPARARLRRGAARRRLAQIHSSPRRKRRTPPRADRRSYDRPARRAFEREGYVALAPPRALRPAALRRFLTRVIIIDMDSPGRDSSRTRASSGAAEAVVMFMTRATVFDPPGCQAVGAHVVSGCSAGACGRCWRWLTRASVFQGGQDRVAQASATRSPSKPIERREFSWSDALQRGDARALRQRAMTNQSGAGSRSRVPQIEPRR